LAEGICGLNSITLSNELLLKGLELSDETLVGVNLASLVSGVVECFLEADVIGLHQVGDDYCGASRDSCEAVAINVSGFAVFIEEVEGLLVIGGQVLQFYVLHLEFLMGINVFLSVV